MNYMPDGRVHYASQTWWFDVQLSYDFTYVAPVENQPVAGYSKDAKDVTTGKDGKATESAPAQTCQRASADLEAGPQWHPGHRRLQ